MKEKALKIVKKIQEKGFIAYWAGGCVRDYLLGKEPKDYDIATNARPEQISSILNVVSEVGKQFGVLLVREGDKIFEVATFRSEKEYTDARHPKIVEFSSPKEDALRRDFTINGLFFDPLNEKIIDFVGGEKDLGDKLVKFIGNPNDRIVEDNLRMLRGIRFKNNLGFDYDKRTWEAIKNNSYKITSVSNERISNELNLMFAHENRANSIKDLSKSDLLKHILPEIEKMKGVPQPYEYHEEGDVYTHTLMAVESLNADSPEFLVWATLLHDSGKPATLTMPENSNDRIRFNKHVKYSAGIASKVARRLKFPNIERETIVWLVKNHMIIGDIDKMALAKKRRLFMDHRFKWLLQLHKADALGSMPRDLGLYEKVKKIYDKVCLEYEEELKRPKHKPLINGIDLINNLKLHEGPEIGNILNEVEDAQLEGKVKTKEEALKYAKGVLENFK